MTDDAKNALKTLLVRLEGAYAQDTLRAYRADFELFIEFCKLHHYPDWPASPEAVAAFIAHLAASGLRSASIRRALCGISTLHHLGRFKSPAEDPEVILAMRRMHRQLGRRTRQAGAIDAICLEQLLAVTDESLFGLRNRVLLLVGYDTLCRRSELTSLLVEDLRPRKILLRHRKTDPNALGRWLSLSARSDQAIRRWIHEAGITQGPILRGTLPNGTKAQALVPGQINRILKGLAKKAGIDPKLVSGQSMRVGAAQDLHLKGASLPDIMHRGRWSKTDTVMRYLESAPARFDDEEEDPSTSAAPEGPA